MKECQLGPMRNVSFQMVSGNFKAFENVDFRHHRFTVRLFALDYNSLFSEKFMQHYSLNEPR